MQTTPAKLLDVVALLEDRPADGLLSGQVGTIVELLADACFAVEFADPRGRTLAVVELPRPAFLVLRYQPALAA